MAYRKKFTGEEKYVRAQAVKWGLAALAAAACAVTVVFFATTGGVDWTAAVRSAAQLLASRPPATVADIEMAPVVKEGTRVSVPEGSPVRFKLTVAPVGEQDIRRQLVLPATVEADPAHTVKVLPPVTGRVTELWVQLGERVAQGQELALLDSGDLAQAYSDVEKAKSVLTLTKKTLDRQLGLEKAGGVAVKDREQAQSDYIQAAAELDRSQLRLRAIGISDGANTTRQLTLKAPVAGSLIDLQVARGSYLNDPTAPIMTIADLGTIWITANVPESETALVEKGQDVSVVLAAYPNETFTGKVLFVSDVLDPDTRRTKVRIAFDNKDIRLKPNMFAEATFLAPLRKVPVVPTQAVILKNETDQVFVEVAPWTFEPRAVEVSLQQGDQAVIERGLKPGERIVVKGGVLLND